MKFLPSILTQKRRVLDRVRRRQIKQRNIFLLVGVILTGLLISVWPTEARQAKDEISHVWRNVQRAGSYEFAADFTQHTISVASVRNIGRSSQRQDIRLEGATDLNEQFLDMTLWSNGGSVLDRTSGLQIKLENGRMQARQGEQQPWQEIQDFSTAIVPQGDFLTFLAGAKEVTNRGEETRNGVTFTRYTYRIDGPAFAAHVQSQIEQQLLHEGALPANRHLQLPENLTNMSGEGELWVDGDGLPLRLLAKLNYPEQNGQEITSDIKVTFNEFGSRPTFWQQAFSDLSGEVVAVQQFVQYGLVAGLAGAFLFFVLRRRNFRVIYHVVVLLCIVSLLFSPLVQGVQAQSSNERFDAYQNRQQTLRDEAAAYEAAQAGQSTLWQDDLAQTGPAALANIRNDSGLDSDADGLTDVQEEFLGSNPFAGNRSHYSANSDDSPLSTPPTNTNLLQLASQDSDQDGLTDYEETLLGTALDNADTDGDTLTDLQEIEGFSYAGEQWYTNPLSVDTNMDGVGDADEWNDGQLHPTWDTDGDNIPDLFDRDNDGDGVPDSLDVSPFEWFDSTTFTGDSPFNLVLEGLTADKPTFVEFQLRPTNPQPPLVCPKPARLAGRRKRQHSRSQRRCRRPRYRSESNVGNIDYRRAIKPAAGRSQH